MAITHLRKAMTDDVPPPFTGISEADETYVGGSWKNRRGALWIRKRQHHPGRGTPKRPLLGLKNRSTGQVRVWCIPNSQTQTIIRCIREQTVQGSTVFSDGWQPYRHLPEYGIHHEYVDHNGREYIRGIVHTQGIEGVWGYLKRKLAAMGGIRRQYLERFVGELVWRYNHRNLSREEQINSLLDIL
jgi:transposase